ncbi:MAG: NADH-quinone oxidoreductase subunit C [Candidatus Aminicenantes bacterium]|nr:NADH-quinone oxidoreductase subunit C [Candidatus Aminicenantes bacterium]
MEKEIVLTALREAFPADVLETSVSLGDPVAVIRPAALAEVMTFLKKEPWNFTMLLDATCLDFPERPERFEMVYHVFALDGARRLRVKASLPGEGAAIASLTGLWKNADWLEREIFDMFGVGFPGHPDLQRLFMYDGFEGHPLRKDYPLRKRQPRLPMRPES